MRNSFFARKIRVLVFSVFSCLCIACLHVFSLAHAESSTVLAESSTVLESGTSGSCTWKYEQIDGNIVLTIAPTDGEEGTLGQPAAYDDSNDVFPADFIPGFPWNRSYYCESAKHVVVKEKVKAQNSAAYMFCNFQDARSIDPSGLDVAGVTNMEGMFEGCLALTKLDVSKWKVSNVTNMEGMFFDCSALATLDVSKWNVSNATTMEQMFGNCSALTKLDVSNWNVSNVTSMEQMFVNCDALTKLDVSNWLATNVSKVTNMNRMFEHCDALTSLDVSKWNVSSVMSMEQMFVNCSALTALDVSKWNVSKVTSMNGMFEGCVLLTSLDIREWNVSNVTSMEEMFEDCFSLTSLDLDKWKGDPKVSTRGMFRGTWSLQRVSLGINFHISDTAEFKDAGSYVGTHWKQVNLGKGGTQDNPKGKVFRSSHELLEFHRDRTKRETDSEEYVRVEVSDDSPDKNALVFQKPEGEKKEPKKSSNNWRKSQKSSNNWRKSQKSSDNVHKSKKSSGNWQERNGKVSYLKDGKKLTGWHHLNGAFGDSSTAKNWFFFDKHGVMLTGRRKLVGGNPNAQGKVEEHWFYFDRKTGRQMRGWIKDEKGAWYYHRPEDGAGLVNGRYEIEGGKSGGKHWFCFNENGLQIRGWHHINNRWHYYSPEDGVGLVGQHELEGGKSGGRHWFYFDEKTGTQIRGWKHIDYQNKWCYYSNEDGTMLKGQHELEGGDAGGKHWFYFDEVTGAELRNCWKEIPSQKKTCYYGSDGAMYKGWRRVNGKNFYFDRGTGARR